MTRETMAALALAAVAALTLAAIVLYGDRIIVAESTADQCDTGRCFICRQPLQAGDDVGSLNDDPGRGLAHFACLDDVYGPLTEERC